MPNPKKTVAFDGDLVDAQVLCMALDDYSRKMRRMGKRGIVFAHDRAKRAERMATAVAES